MVLSNRRWAAALPLAIAAASLFPLMSKAAPNATGFGPAIEGYSGYEGQSKCSPYAKPGVLAFQRIVLEAYPGTGAGSISRDCDVGGQSEHKEGRAWDWGVNAGVPYQKAAADSFTDWLMREDRFGNDDAMARRLGVMYMIWDRKVWFPGGDWETYCVQKRFGCHEPGDRDSLRHPHTDHVHFSFTWDGAKKRTSYWNKIRSMLPEAAAPPGADGLWLLGRNGAILPLDLGYYGSKADGGVSRLDLIALASTPTGYGYWMLARTGEVKGFGDADLWGSAAQNTDKAVDIAATPGGDGYWIVTKKGRVFPFGDAEDLGSPSEVDSPVVGIAPAPSGLGLWVAQEDGRVTPLGEAGYFGGLVGEASDVRGLTPTPSGQGYWLFTASGRVAAFGDAPSFGDLAGSELTQEIVDLIRSGSGEGYWLIGERGKVAAFGDAPKLDISDAAAGRRAARPPVGLTPRLALNH